MWQREGDAGRVRLGPFDFEVAARHDAWHVVDGQQRLISLAAALMHPDPEGSSAASSTFLCWYDLRLEKFLDHGGTAPELVPVHRLFDAVDLAEWLEEHKLGRDLARKAHAVGKVLREYRVPVYVIETEDKAMLIEVFERTNNFGKALTQIEVFDALVGSASKSPERIQDLLLELGRAGMGSPNETLGLRIVLTLAGFDPWTTFKDLSSEKRAKLHGIVPEAIEPARQALDFLRDAAEISHLRLLPRSWPLIALTRFFHRFPTPRSRSITLLSRWLWRGVIAGPSSSNEKTMLRRAVRAVNEDASEHDVVQTWLSLVPASASKLSAVAVPAGSGAKTAAFRVVMASLAGLGPLDADTGVRLDVARLLEEHGTLAFAQLVSGGDSLSTIGNRVLQEPGPDLANRLRAASPKVRRSHAMPALLDENPDDVIIRQRETAVQNNVDRFVERMTAFELGDRPELEALLSSARSLSN